MFETLAKNILRNDHFQRNMLRIKLLPLHFIQLLSHIRLVTSISSLFLHFKKLFSIFLVFLFPCFYFFHLLHSTSNISINYIGNQKKVDDSKFYWHLNSTIKMVSMRKYVRCKFVEDKTMGNIVIFFYFLFFMIQNGSYFFSKKIWFFFLIHLH